VSDSVRHEIAINDLLTRFFRAFDEKDWSTLRDCLCDRVFTDYSSFRGEPASTISGDEYVEQRRVALEELDTEHDFLDLSVESGADAEWATARCDYVVLRFHSSFDGANDQYFHSYGRYRFGCAKIGGAWKIARITQSLLRNEGNREIHGATRTRNGSA
jgi:SnoaL-like domain